MVQSGTAEVRLPMPLSNTSNSISYVVSTGVHHSPCRQARPNSERQTPIVAAGVSRPAGSISHHRCARFRTQRLTPADPCRGSRGEPPRTTKTESEGKVMGKLEGKVAVITGGSSGMALASAKRFVEEGAYVFITGRRQEQLDEAVKLIGRNVTGVRGDAANLDDLGRLFDTVKREKGKIDVLFASAGKGEAVPLGEITEQHFDAAFGLNTRGTLFTVQKALPLFNDGASIIMTGSNASVKGFPGWGVYAASKLALRSFARTWLNELKGRNIRVNVLVPGAIATPMQEEVLTKEAKEMFESLIPRGKMGQSEEVATVALFLASDDSSFVNGAELFVDGGMTAI